jgi:transcriptional regulator with XRE-family HTH domain
MARTKARPKARPGAGDSGRSISYQLRAAIRSAGESLYQLGRRAEVDPGSISRFLAGERDIGISIVDRLCESLKLKLADRGGGRRRRADEDDDLTTYPKGPEMSHPKNEGPMKPGQHATRSGQYEEVTPEGVGTGHEVTMPAGHVLPPTEKAGDAYVLADPSDNKAGRGE